MMALPTDTWTAMLYDFNKSLVVNGYLLTSEETSVCLSSMTSKKLLYFWIYCSTTEIPFLSCLDPGLFMKNNLSAFLLGIE